MVNNEVCYWQKVLKEAKSNRRRLNAPSFSDLFLPYRYIYISEPIFSKFAIIGKNKGRHKKGRYCITL